MISRATVDSSSVTAEWPFNLAPVQQLCSEGLDLQHRLTFIVGENGSGKSTIVEAIAEAYGMDVRGGHSGRRYASSEEKSPLGDAMRLDLAPQSRGRHGFFLRSETAHGVFQFMSDYGVAGYGERHLGAVSHGEGYLQVLEGRFQGRGLYLLDEPEAPLSFQSCLVLVRVLFEAVERGSQVICATHSPLLTALPDAQILELGPEGIRTTCWEDLEVVGHWRRFLHEPRFYLRHLLD